MTKDKQRTFGSQLATFQLSLILNASPVGQSADSAIEVWLFQGTP